MASIYDWSQTANDNADADSGINWEEGQAPSTVNNSARAMMGRLAEWRDSFSGGLATTGSANAQNLSIAPQFDAYANGLIIAFRAGSGLTNTGAATLNVNGKGVKSIRVIDTSGDRALYGNEIRASGLYLAMYSTAANSASGGWILLSPSPSTTSFFDHGTTSLDATTTSTSSTSYVALSTPRAFTTRSSSSSCLVHMIVSGSVNSGFTGSLEDARATIKPVAFVSGVAEDVGLARMVGAVRADSTNMTIYFECNFIFKLLTTKRNSALQFSVRSEGLVTNAVVTLNEANTSVTFTECE